MKFRVLNYTFDASLKTVTFTDINPIELAGVFLVTNVEDNIIIFNFADSAKGGSVATNVLTLDYDTTTMADADELSIIYDDGVESADGNLRVTVGSQGLYCGGTHAHDAADGGNPVKIGGKAHDYTPDSDGSQGPAAVAANDRVNASPDLRGHLVERVLAERNLLTGLDQIYDGTPSTDVSANITCEEYRWAGLSYALDITATPGTIRFDIEVSLDGTTWARLVYGPLAALIYDDTSIGGSGVEEAIFHPIACRQIRVRVTCTGVDGTNKFTLDDTTLYLRN